MWVGAHRVGHRFSGRPVQREPYGVAGAAVEQVDDDGSVGLRCATVDAAFLGRRQQRIQTDSHPLAAVGTVRKRDELGRQLDVVEPQHVEPVRVAVLHHGVAHAPQVGRAHRPAVTPDLGQSVGNPGLAVPAVGVVHLHLPAVAGVVPGQAVDVFERRQQFQQRHQILGARSRGHRRPSVRRLRDQRDVGGEDDESVPRDQRQIAFKPVELVGGNVAAKRPVLPVCVDAGVLHVVQRHEMHIPVIERVVGRPEMPLVGLVGEPLVRRRVIQIVVAGQIPLRYVQQAHHPLVAVVDGQVVVGHVAHGQPELHAVGVAHERVDQILPQHVLADIEAGLRVGKAMREEPVRRRFQRIQGEVDGRWQRPGSLDHGEPPPHRRPLDRGRRAGGVVPVEELRDVVLVHRDGVT